MNTATIYDLTAKEYMHLGKVFNDSFQMPTEKVMAFLARVKRGNDIRIFYDSKGVPEGFYDDEEYIQWREIDTWDGSPTIPHLNKLNCKHERIDEIEGDRFCLDCLEDMPIKEQGDEWSVATEVK